jgi:hypothetical protein
MKKENWEKEEWGGWKIVSNMLDHPDKNGIYPTSKCYQNLYEFVVAQKEKACQQERERIIEKLEKMRKNLPDKISVKIDVEHGFNAIKGLGYNQAINDIIKSLIIYNYEERKNKKMDL